MALPALRSPLGTKRGGRWQVSATKLALKTVLAENTKLTKTNFVSLCLCGSEISV